MNVIRKYCIRSLKENRRRTILTILGVAMTTALITVVACMMTSFVASMAESLKQVEGDAHVIFRNVSRENLKYIEDNQNLESQGYYGKVGYADYRYEDSHGNHYGFYLCVGSADENWFRGNGIHLTKGRFPQAEDEIVIDMNFVRRGLRLKLGDEIRLAIGDRYLGDQAIPMGERYQEKEEIKVRQEKTYTVVGIVDGQDSRVPISTTMKYYIGGSGIDGFGAYVYLPKEKLETFDVSARYDKKAIRHIASVNAGLLGISEELYTRVYGDYWKDGQHVSDEELQEATRIAQNLHVEYYLAAFESWNMNNPAMMLILGLFSMVFLIVCFAGVFCINNSFSISLTEKTQFYGMMTSVGMTKRQRRQFVWQEALVIGGFGIPAGVLFGLILAYGLILIADRILAHVLTITLQYFVSWRTIFAGVLVSVLMVILSAAESAARSARISPIAAIRANGDLAVAEKEKKKAKKTAKEKNATKEKIFREEKAGEKHGWMWGFLTKKFSVSSRIAYLNASRAKQKYQAIVTSMVVGVALFVGMSFLGMIQFGRNNNPYARSIPYQIDLVFSDPEDYEKALEIRKLPGVKNLLVRRFCTMTVASDQMTFVPGEDFQPNQGGYYPFGIHALDEESFRACCDQVGVSYEEAKDGAIVIDTYPVMHSEGGNKFSLKEKRVAEFTVGSRLEGISYYLPNNQSFGAPAPESVTLSLTVRALTKEVPPMLSSNIDMFRGYVQCIVCESFADSQECLKNTGTNVFVTCDDALAVEDEIRDFLEGDENARAYELYNHDSSYQYSNNVLLIVRVFLIGFLSVIVLIGVTNVFNTVTAGMQLREPEFAMLQAVGMTKKELWRMVWTENFFHVGKALLIGLPLGCMISYGIYRYFWEISDGEFEFAWRLPLWEMLISGVAILCLLQFLSQYSMKRIGKSGIVETIRNENI